MDVLETAFILFSGIKSPSIASVCWPIFTEKCPHSYLLLSYSVYSFFRPRSTFLILERNDNLHPTFSGPRQMLGCRKADS